MLISPVSHLSLACPGQPFSTELVFERLSASWANKLSTRYFTYSVHVSGAFLQPPTLGSSLYLLLLRLQARGQQDTVKTGNCGRPYFASCPA